MNAHFWREAITLAFTFVVTVLILAVQFVLAGWV